MDLLNSALQIDVFNWLLFVVGIIGTVFLVLYIKKKR